MQQKPMWADHRPELQPSPFSGPERPSWVSIAVGVAVGILVAGAVAWGVRIYMVQQALKTFEREMMTLQRNSQQTMQRHMREVEEREKQRRQELQARQQAERQVIADRQRVAEQARRDQADEAQRKAQAWAKFNRNLKTCDQADGNAFVECTNAHIRAKREFERLYAEGRL